MITSALLFGGGIAVFSVLMVVLVWWLDKHDGSLVLKPPANPEDAKRAMTWVYTFEGQVEGFKTLFFQCKLYGTRTTVRVQVGQLTFKLHSFVKKKLALHNINENKSHLTVNIETQKRFDSHKNRRPNEKVVQAISRKLIFPSLPDTGVKAS